MLLPAGVTPAGCCSCRLLSPLTGWPWQQPAAPLRGGLGRSLVVGGQPYMGAGHGWSPLLAAFAIRMEKMKEVKRPPL
ncbi:hypothetical protein B296_00052349 [Ensete ventricosum]|uniref:Uncharacterized protein n=1 Tax=Ensete ventricosum TaxID=4639 RepID=A0A426WWG7_ENSVE|nr:hypothetical protein B296_00052349 [Ensete ventricosum]